MSAPVIRKATRADAPQLNAALRQLSDALGDTHRASDALIAESGFGAIPSFYAVLAEQEGQIVGAAVFSPLFSTTRGQAGVYVSDIWVAPGQRRQRLGVRLVEAVHNEANAAWGAGFIRLSVYQDSTQAQAFYLKLGFQPLTGETGMILEDSVAKFSNPSLL